ncbi:MAG TPA: hypothetical protein VH419_06250 [Nocardioidaceae bacterium]|jgi:hypothetical protein
MSAIHATSSQDLLALYLNDHLLGASGGVELFRRAARGQSGDAARTRLEVLTRDVEQDRDALVDLMKQLDVRPARHRVALGWLGEKVGRLKLNGSLLSRTPLTDLVELEYLRLGVEGKLAGWEAVEVAAGADHRIDLARVEELQQRAKDQLEALEELRREAARHAFAGRSEGPQK